jgi:hypothetical protein
MRMKRLGLLHIAFGILLAGLLLSGCKHAGCTDPLSTNYDPKAIDDDGSCSYPAPTLALHFEHVVGALPYSTATVYQDSSGRSFQLSTARFYTSSPALVQGGSTTPISKYLQVVAGNDVNYTLGQVNAGSYSGFQFDLGVDSVTNHSDPLLFPEGHALAATSPTNDHWTWNVGYVFLKIIGDADTSAARTGVLNFHFEMHIATDPLLSRITLAKNFDLVEGQTQTLNIKVDWMKAFSGYDFRRSTHTTDVPSVAARAMRNLVTGITIQ